MNDIYENKGLTSEEKRVRTVVTTTYNNKLAMDNVISNLIEEYEQQCMKLAYIDKSFHMFPEIDDTYKAIEKYLFNHEVNEYLKAKGVDHYGLEDLKLYSLTYEYETGKNIQDLKQAYNIYDLLKEIKKEKNNEVYVIKSGLENVFDKKLLSEYKEDSNVPKKVLKTKEELMADQNKLFEQIANLKNDRGILDGVNANYAGSLVNDLFKGYYYELNRAKASLRTLDEQHKKL